MSILMKSLWCPWSGALCSLRRAGGRLPWGLELIPARFEASFHCVPIDSLGLALPDWAKAWRAIQRPGARIGSAEAAVACSTGVLSVWCYPSRKTGQRWRGRGTVGCPSPRPQADKPESFPKGEPHERENGSRGRTRPARHRRNRLEGRQAFRTSGEDGAISDVTDRRTPPPGVARPTVASSRSPASF
jgi:hypothetical protein